MTLGIVVTIVLASFFFLLDCIKIFHAHICLSIFPSFNFFFYVSFKNANRVFKFSLIHLTFPGSSNERASSPKGRNDVSV
jgi:hypothetical protein